MIRKVARADVPILVTGPTGAGKEVVARALHALSGRSGRLIAINCGAIPHELLESQLFGHERGAFTGAHAKYIGLMEQADGGTLFLDEIGEMPESVQVKLLRVLETQEIHRLGGTGPIPVSFRLVSATNRMLPSAVQNGSFRADLFYRIGVFTLAVPPLCNHVSDIPALLAHMARRTGASPLALSEAALRVLFDHDWPGNVRELRNFHDRAQVLFGAGKIGATDASLALFEETGPPPVGPRSTPVSGAASGAASVAATAPHTMRDALLETGKIDLNEALTKLECALIGTALEQSGNNITNAAQRLGLKRTTLLGRMKKLGLAAPARWPQASVRTLALWFCAAWHATCRTVARPSSRRQPPPAPGQLKSIGTRHEHAKAPVFGRKHSAGDRCRCRRQ